MPRWIPALVALLLLAPPARLAAQRPASPHAPAPPPAALIQQFQNRIQAYLKQLHRAESGLPGGKPTDSAAALAQRRAAIAARLRAARRDARPGAIFSPAIAAQFRAWIASTFAGPAGHDIRLSLQRAEPLGSLKLAVNQPYPSGIPLQSTPPTLLLNLPQLPKPLEYRLVGTTLVLHDRDSNLIVDYLLRAVPAVAH